MFGEVALDGSDAAAKSFTSHYTTHDGMQAILDFPFQDAARGFASRLRRPTPWRTSSPTTTGTPTPTPTSTHCRPSSATTTWAGSAASSPPTTPGRPPSRELLPATGSRHELMYLSRGNPVVYYGDEQGFTGTGGDQLARQTMFASQVPEYLDDDLLGTDRTGADDNFVTSHPLYRAISELAALTDRHPALRNGAQQVRLASDSAGIFAFSRMDRRQPARVRGRPQQQREAASAPCRRTCARAGSPGSTAPARHARHRRATASSP